MTIACRAAPVTPLLSMCHRQVAYMPSEHDLSLQSASSLSEKDGFLNICTVFTLRFRQGYKERFATWRV